MFGLASVLAKLSPLEYWSAVGAIVAGIIAAILFVGGIGRWLLDLWRRPRLEVICGNEKEFNRRMVKTLSLYTDFAEGREVLAAHAKFLRVNETHGHIARDVRAWITAVDPEAPDEVSAVKLRWWTGDHSTDIVGGNHDYLFLQHVAILDTGHATTTPTNFQHHSPIEIDVTLYVDGKKHSTTRFRIEHPWPGIPLDLAMQREEDDPVKVPSPDQFPYPLITKLAPRKSHWWSR